MRTRRWKGDRTSFKYISLNYIDRTCLWHRICEDVHLLLTPLRFRYLFQAFPYLDSNFEQSPKSNGGFGRTTLQLYYNPQYPILIIQAPILGLLSSK